MAEESLVQKAIFTKVNLRKNSKVFRNNVGSVQIDKRYIEYGLHKGSADLIGWETIEITPDMVGQKIARFLSIECKSKKGKPTDQQLHWAEMVNNAGGKSIIARSVADV